jgi:adenylylsulfate kinase
MKISKGIVIWFFGLSGSGKSTLAEALDKKLTSEGVLTRRLDGDVLRERLNADLGFEEKDRKENIRRVAEVSKLFAETGVVTICSFITPTKALRALAKDRIGEELFVDVYVDCSIEKCINRDVKGLYKKALNKEILNFTGISAPFEKPESCRFLVNTEEKTIEECVENLYSFLKTESF